MEKSDQIKEQIILQTMELINESNGDVRAITTRIIAEKAGVAVGLINYHFQTKDKLIEICVQKIIQEVIVSVPPPPKEFQNGLEHLIWRATQVFDFLFEHQAVSRISILSDLTNFTLNNNSDNSKKGFIRTLSNYFDVKDKNILAFSLTCAMQTAFLASNVSIESLGYDFSSKIERDMFIEKLVTMLYNGNSK